MPSKNLTRNIFLALALGVAVGTVLPQAAPYVSWLGLIFKLSLAMIVMPIIFTSILGGMASIGDVRKLGDLGVKTLVYYLSTTLIAVTIGLVLVSTIKPGVRAPADAVKEAINNTQISDARSAAGLLALVATEKQHLNEEQSQDLLTTLTELENQGKTSGELKNATLRLLGSLEFRERLKEDSKPKQIESMNVADFLTAQISKALINPFEALAGKHVLAVILFTILLGGALTTVSHGRKYSKSTKR